jgi:transposase
VLAMSFEDQKKLSSIIDYLSQGNRKQVLQKWTDQKTDSLSSMSVMQEMKLDYISPYQKSASPHMEGELLSYQNYKNQNEGVSVSGYEYIFPVNLNSASPPQKIAFDDGRKTLSVKLDPATSQLFVSVKESGQNVVIDLSKAATPKPESGKTLSLNGTSATMKAALVLTNLNGHIDKKNVFHAESFGARLLIRFK